MTGAGRVIAGRAAGLRLAAPPGGTRPLGDRVKEALFAILEPDLPGVRFLDLCAGSGAGGIEALSRGAAGATFVEQDPAAAQVIRDNLARARFAGPAVAVVRAEAVTWLGSPGATQDGPFDLVLVDPPYHDESLLVALLGSLGRAPAGGLLAPRATVVAKHFRRTVPGGSIGLLRSIRERRFGETTLTFYRRAGMEDG
jgi:16S rRNA (guanine966-N2)-methyltransferase